MDFRNSRVLFNFSIGEQVTLDKQITVGIVSQQRINEMYAGRKGAVGQSRILCRTVERNAIHDDQNKLLADAIKKGNK